MEAALRERARRQAATATGLVVDTPASGSTSQPRRGTTDDARIRHFPSGPRARLLATHDASEQQLRTLAGEALGEVYFRDGGRAVDLEVEFTGVERVQFDL
ncbi:hypothetical protein AB0G55_21500 [Streptomyces toyocaensis]|uniref:hypothetical protein n=1 Tax=Streptomyces toyocaensis TaxID=55952 RepID=UPI000689793F|nr:hypothetical protein [Streptomyces toyocaensis]